MGAIRAGFAVKTTQLARAGNVRTATAYVLISLVGSLAASFGGIFLANIAESLVICIM